MARGKVITCTPPPEGIKGMPYEEFDQWQKAKSCVVLHDTEGYDVIQEDIRLAGESYHPMTEPIQAMLRVINAHKALAEYARAHQEAELSIRVTDDDDIPMNNSYYVISKGIAKKTAKPDPKALILTISQLAEFIFKDETAEMNLMLNS